MANYSLGSGTSEIAEERLERVAEVKSRKVANTAHSNKDGRMEQLLIRMEENRQRTYDLVAQVHRTNVTLLGDFIEEVSESPDKVPPPTAILDRLEYAIFQQQEALDQLYKETRRLEDENVV